jgi:hypothetical protein
MTRLLAVPVVLLLAGCAGSGGWSKPGADDAATASAYQDCAASAQTATRTDFDIDQDISATRSSDLQHGDILQTQLQQMRDSNRDRADAILAACMEGKGFTKSGK